MAPGNIKANGSWNELVGVNAKVNGTWKEIAEGYTKVNGTWQQWFVSSQPALELIQTISGAAANYTFSNIPQNYTHLEIRANIKSTRSSNDDILDIRINNNTDTKYYYQSMTDSSIVNVRNRAEWRIEAMFANQASMSSPMFMYFNDYSDNNKAPIFRALWAGRSENQAAFQRYVNGIYDNAEAITSLSFSPTNGDFTLNSEMSLYGVLGA